MLLNFRESLNKMKIALVSKSSARREVMELLGFENLQICDSKFAEDLDKSKYTNEEYVTQTCRGKYQSFRDHQLTERIAVAVFFDTVIVNPLGKIFEKPATENEHFEMIKILSGKTHSVYTAMVISYNPRLVAEGLGLNDSQNYEGKEVFFI